MLSKHPDLCKYPHGHSRKLEFVLESETLDENDMVCDFKILKEAMSEFLYTLDHSLCMNTEDPKYDDFKNTFGERIIGFNKKDPTTEVIAETIFNVANTKLNEYSVNLASKYPLRKCVKLLSVRLWETSSSWAEFSPKNFQ